ncbi:hypothetical protein QCE73_00210 [Caballeronia sp. LZ029]|uniref:hypothetical protein n=1 Tax=Caballeronia sp. LZ029 TaxID=3038564 RepID=UPI002864CECF|nr:hypothetical protein [Caballeronia sp. LZ029]MDR5741570.1 hypothetical protein [Caballeronia sp. LZ029]
MPDHSERTSTVLDEPKQTGSHTTNEVLRDKALLRIEEAANGAHALAAVAALQLSGVELDTAEFCVLVSDAVELLNRRLHAVHLLIGGGGLPSTLTEAQ